MTSRSSGRSMDDTDRRQVDLSSYPRRRWPGREERAPVVCLRFVCAVFYGDGDDEIQLRTSARRHMRFTGFEVSERNKEKSPVRPTSGVPSGFDANRLNISN